MFQCKHLLFPLLSHTWRDWKVLRGCWWRNAINFFRPSPAHRALQTAAAFLAFLSTSQDAFSSTNNGCSIVSEFLLPITKCNRTALCNTGCLGFSPYLVRLKCIFSNDHWSPDTWILCPINFLHWDFSWYAYLTGTCSAKRVDIEILVWKMIYESFFQLVLSVFCTGASDDYYGGKTMMLAISITLDIRLGQEGTIMVIMIWLALPVQMKICIASGQSEKVPDWTDKSGLK